MVLCKCNTNTVHRRGKLQLQLTSTLGCCPHHANRMHGRQGAARRRLGAICRVVDDGAAPPGALQVAELTVSKARRRACAVPTRLKFCIETLRRSGALTAAAWADMSRRLCAACAQHSCRRGAAAVVKPRRPACRHGSRGVASPICGSRRCRTSAVRCVERMTPDAAAPEEAKAAMAAAPFKTARKAELCCMHFKSRNSAWTFHARKK